MGRGEKIQASILRTGSIMKKEFRQFFRNIALVLLVIFAVILDPWAASEMTFDLKHYGFSFLDFDQSSQSAQLLEKLRPPYFRLHSEVYSHQEAEELLLSGEVGLVIIIPKGFQRNLSSGKSTEISVILDGTNSNSSTVALSYFAGIVEQFSQNIMLNQWSRYPGSQTELPMVEPVTRVLYNENLQDNWYLVLSEFLNAITMIAIILPAAATVYEKQTGTMEQLIVTPLRIYEIMIGKILPMAMIILVAAYVGIYTVLTSIVGVPLRGSILYFTLVTVVFLFTTAGLGMLVATVANNLAETILATLIILIPIMFLSGTWTPPEAMPEWMQWLIVLSPLKYYLEICYGIFLRGTGFDQSWPSLLTLALLGTIIFSAGAIRFRKNFA